MFSAQGTGCGAVSDSYKAVFKYRDHAIERMSLPSDLEEDYDCGLQVDLIQEPEIDRYSAYCPYFDEQIFFHAENIEGYPPSDKARITGANARGFSIYASRNTMEKRYYRLRNICTGKGEPYTMWPSHNFLSPGKKTAPQR